MLKKEICLVSLAFSLASVSINAVGAEFDASVYSNVAFTDNADLVTTGPRSETSQIFGLSIDVEENRKNFQTDANLRLEEERNYDSSSESSTSLNTGFGLISVGFIESFLDWRATFNRSQILDDALAEDLDESREFRNIFTTGPSINYRFTRTTSLNASSNFVAVENSNPNVADSRRIENSLGLNYAVNTVTSVNVGSTYERLIDGDGQEEFDSINFNAGLSRRFNNGSFSMSIGQKTLRPERTEETETLFADIVLQRSQFFKHDVRVRYSQNVSDTGIGFDNDESIDDTRERLVGVSQIDIVVLETYEVSASRSFKTFTYSVSGFVESEDYRDQDLDERGRGLSLGLSEQIGSGITASFNYNFDLRNLLQRDDVGKEKTHTYALSSAYDFTPELSFNGSMGFEIRQNNRNQTREYEEFTFSVGVNYDIW